MTSGEPRSRIGLAPPTDRDDTRDPVTLAEGRRILRQEAEALAALADSLGNAFLDAVGTVLECRESVIVTGIGKAGLVGQKISATLASTGTRSHFLHAAEAVHGDLGRVRTGDVLLVLSFSGETSEILQLLPIMRERRVPIIAMTARHSSRLGRAASVVIELGDLDEAGADRLAPSTSTTAMIALGDALALSASCARGLTPDDFGRNHPAGSLGLLLSSVDDHMRPLADCRIAAAGQSVREVLVEQSRPGRRAGAVLVVDAEHRLCGIFTDSDLARLLEGQQDARIDGPIADVMTRDPSAVRHGAPLREAVATLRHRKISELPVIDQRFRPVGMLDVTDIVASLPALARMCDAPADASEATTVRPRDEQRTPFLKRA